MFISTLSIRNFRCFGKIETTINLNDQLTALIGRNGSGKTAILEALNFLIGQDYLPTRISEKDFHHDAKEIKDEIHIECETKFPFFATLDVRESEYQRLETVIIPCNKIRLTIKRREKPERVLDDPFIINKHVLPIEGEINENIFNENEKARKVMKVSKLKEEYTIYYKLKNGQERNANIFNYQLTYNPNRLTKCPKSYYLTKNRDNDVSGNYSFISKILIDLHWKYARELAKHSDNTIKNEYAALATSLRGIVDEKGELIRQINERIASICSDNKDFQIDFIDIEQPYKSAFVSKSEGDKLLAPENLGSGFNILIAYALFAYIASLEKSPIVLLIDEPELHLHCDWQKKMYDVFSKQTDLQIIYTTQSENFISLKNWKQIKSISDFQIFPKENVLQEKVMATDGQSGTREEYLNDLATRNLHISTILRENLELLFVRKVILVEGPSEKYGLPKLLSLAGCAIETQSVAIIATWGKTKIKNYQMICKVFGKDYFTIFDNDKATDDEPANENITIENNAQPKKFIRFSTSFEILLGVTGNDKFQKLVKAIDIIVNINMVSEEIQDAIDSIKNFVESR